MIKVINLIEQEQRYLKGVSAMFRSPVVDSEEVLSKFYLRICENEYEVDSIEGFKKWAYTIIRNISKNEYKTSKIKVWGNSDELIPKIEPSYIPKYAVIDYFKILEESLILSNKEKVIIKARLEGYRYKEISELLSIPLSTSKTAYKYGITKFRNELQKKGMD